MSGRGRFPRRRDRGFSLLELLVAIALLVALLGAMFAFFWDMLSVRRRVVEESGRRRAVSALLEHLERDLFTCVVGDGLIGAGVRGDATSMVVVSRSVPARRAAEGAEAFADLERSEYRFDAGRGEIAASRSVVTPGRGAAGGPTLVPLGEGVFRVRFRFHDGRRWRDAFDSLEAGRLPALVEAAVWLDPWPGETGAETDEGREAGFAERGTFDVAAGFDERAFAEASALEVHDEPRPDRVRVMLVPGAAAPAPPPEGGAP